MQEFCGKMQRVNHHLLPKTLFRKHSHTWEMTMVCIEVFEGINDFMRYYSDYCGKIVSRFSVTKCMTIWKIYHSKIYDTLLVIRNLTLWGFFIFHFNMKYIQTLIHDSAHFPSDIYLKQCERLLGHINSHP